MVRHRQHIVLRPKTDEGAAYITLYGDHWEIVGTPVEDESLIIVQPKTGWDEVGDEMEIRIQDDPDFEIIEF